MLLPRRYAEKKARRSSRDWKEMTEMLTGKMLQPGDNRFAHACAVDMHMDISKEAYVRLYRRNAARPTPGEPFCASQRSRNCRNAYRHVRRAIWCKKRDRKNAAPQARDNRFVRTCAVEMYMDISEKQFYARIYRENDSDAGRMEHPDQTSAFTLTVNCKNPLVWKHCFWGENCPE